VVVIVCALLAVGAIGFTLLVRDQDIPPAPLENPELKHQEARRQVLYDNLKDLQFEYHQGKLSDGDYNSLKAGFLYDLAGVMDSIERLQSVRAATGRERPSSSKSGQTAGSKAAPAPAAKAKSKTQEIAAPAGEVKCPSCDSSNPVSNRFCGKCGAALS
jgi:hypothetical protein